MTPGMCVPPLLMPRHHPCASCGSAWAPTMGTHYVRERDLQTTPESPQLVHASYMDDQGVLGKLHFGHCGVTPSGLLSLPRTYHPTRRSLALASAEGYSPKCLEGEFCELRQFRVLGRLPMPRSVPEGILTLSSVV